MKYSARIVSIALALIFVVVACEKENNAPEFKAGETVTITATLPSVPAANPSTKVDFTQGEKRIDLAWSESDKLTIINEANGEYSVFTLTSISGDKANFTGIAIEGDSFTVLYPGTITSVDDMDSHSFVGQTQTGDANLQHLKTSWTAKITGLSDFSDVKFAAPAGGTFDQSGIIKFRLQMPDYVSTVTSVSIEAPTDVFYTDNDDTQAGALSLALSSVTLDAKHAFTAYLAISQKDSDAISIGETVTIKVVDDEGTEWKKEITLTEEFSLQAGKVNVITLNKDDWDTTERYAGGTGVDGDPWIITKPIHMVHMAADLESTTKYFKLGADVDMDGITWSPMNADSGYDKVIDLDGDDHKISHLGASLFYVFKGSVKKLELYNCSITQRGILAEYCQGKGHTITNVTVSNGTVNYSGANPGGLIGTINSGSGTTATIMGCTVSDTDVTGTGVVGGLIGFADALVNIIGCSYTGGTVTATARYCGGLIGSTGNYSSDISDCHVENATINSTSDRVGGFVGQVQTNVSISGCTANNVTVTGGPNNANSNTGGFAGTLYGTTTNCHVTGTSSVACKNTTTNANIQVGGFSGYITGTASGCSSTATIGTSSSPQVGAIIGGFAGILRSGGSMIKCSVSGDVYSTDKYIGGLVGKTEAGSVSKCYSAGKVYANNNVGGLIGWVGGAINISNSYSTGDVTATAQRAGGLVGLVETTDAVTIEKCYASGDVGDLFSNGGLICRISNNRCTVQKCAAWNGTVSANNRGTANWSTGAVVGVTHPNCILTDNYRNPSMTLLAWWVPDSDYNHPNVNGTTTPLLRRNSENTDMEAVPTTLTAFNSSDGQACRWAYHGKVEAGKTLSELASTTLGWDSAIWDFSGALPTLLP